MLAALRVLDRLRLGVFVLLGMAGLLRPVPAAAWKTLLNGTAPGSNIAYDAVVDAAGNTFVAGDLATLAGGSDFAVFKIAGGA
jgi:hypothetical protein